MPTKIDTSDFDGRSTATSALGALLSTGNFHAVAHSQVLSADQGINVESTAKIAAEHRKPHPSNTSRYYSFDYGLVHFIALDLNVRQIQNSEEQKIMKQITQESCIYINIYKYIYMLLLKYAPLLYFYSFAYFHSQLFFQRFTMAQIPVGMNVAWHS